MKRLLFLTIITSLLFGSVEAQLERANFPISKNQVALKLPFVGGLSNPQFSNFDFDLDGTLDLLVFDRNGNQILPFVWSEAIDFWEFRPEYISQFPTNLKGFVIIQDYNNDGVHDIFTESTVSGIAGVSLFEGKVENDTYTFELATQQSGNAFLEYPVNNSLTPIYINTIDIPVIKDVDGDGDIDILAFESGGSTIHYYKNIDRETNSSLRSLSFVLEDRCWGKVLEAEGNEEIFLSDIPTNCASSSGLDGNRPIELRHAGSTLLMTDIDGNGLQDMLVGDFISDGLIALYNNGSESRSFVTEQEADFPQSDSSVAIDQLVAAFLVDVNQDGKEELVASPNVLNASKNFEHVWMYENNSDQGLDPQFVQNDFLIREMIDYSEYSVPAIADVNQDGLDDIVIGVLGMQEFIGSFEPRLILLENVGSRTAPSFEIVDEDYLEMSRYQSEMNFNGLAPAFGDLDSDGDIDLVIGLQSGYLMYFENRAGSGQPFDFKFEVEEYQGIDVGSWAIPYLADVNKDGLTDILVGQSALNAVDRVPCGSINYFQNIGSPGNPTFQSDPQMAPNDQCFGEVNTQQGIGIARAYSSPQWISNADGDVLITGSFDQGVLFYEANGETFNQVPTELQETVEKLRIHPRLHDFDNDGFYELIVGNARGGLGFYKTQLQDRTSSTSTNQPLEELQVFPNPVEDQFFLNVEDRKLRSFEILNLQGQLVKRGRLIDRLSLSDISTGVYLLRVLDDGKWQTTKIVKL